MSLNASTEGKTLMRSESGFQIDAPGGRGGGRDGLRWMGLDRKEGGMRCDGSKRGGRRPVAGVLGPPSSPQNFWKLK